MFLLFSYYGSWFRLASIAMNFGAYEFLLPGYGYRYLGNFQFLDFWYFWIFACCFIMYLIISLFWGLNFLTFWGLGSELD